jgi:hypothetical protein
MTTLQKTQIKPTWSLEKVQEMSAKVLADTYMNVMPILEKSGHKEEFEKLNREEQVKYYRSLNVKNPLELLQAKAEFEANVWGSKIEVWGDEKEAHLKYLSCAMWDKMAEKMSEECMQKAGEGFQNCVSNFAKEFGYTGEVKFEGEKTAIITVRK